MTFKDYFSQHASTYARHRPQYPPELFAWLASIAPARDLAWDCATGNGQAALGLIPHFGYVVATDASKEQIRNAFAGERLAYCVCTAEKTPIASECIDLVTIAQALHWLNTEVFFEEARRVLVPGGVVAAWAYTMCNVSPEVDRIVDDFYFRTVHRYWPKERALVDARYEPINVPFREIKAPEFNIDTRWQAEDLLAYVRTWSAVQHYMKVHGSDPVDLIQPAVLDAWGPNERPIRWPIYTRVGVKD